MSFKINKLGIAVSSYSEEGTSPKRYSMLRESLETLTTTINDYNGLIDVIAYVVVDGPVPKCHNDILAEFSDNLEIVRKPQNGGIARIKNTGIRLLLEQKVDVGILVDDDVWYGEGWIESYCNVIEDLQIHHLAWCNDKHLFYGDEVARQKRNIRELELSGHRLLSHIAAAGIFLTFTPELIEKIGYFRVMPGKIGAEHLQFSRRAFKQKMIKYMVDIADSHRFIKHLGYLVEEGELTDDLILSSVSKETLTKEKINFGLSRVDLDQKIPCIE